MRESILRAWAGELVVEDEDLGRIVRSLAAARAARRATRVTSLTVREIEVLRALAQGMATAEIAEDLRITPATVQSHVKNILSKLGVHSKVEAVTLAWRHGLVPISRSA